MSIEYPENGQKNVGFSAEDNCGNETRGTRMVNIIQKLLEGRYVEIVESGDSVTISVNLSADYYNKFEINELLGNLGTVQFKIVSVLPSVGAANVIYLVEKTAPDVGYDQYIWNTEDMRFYPIGDTDIDLSDYYTKLQADNKFQEKLTADGSLPSLIDSTELSQVSVSGKTVRQTTAQTIWNYIRDKITGSASSAITDLLTRSRVIVTDADSKLNVSSVYSAELEQLSGIDTTKTVQAQLNAKQDRFSYTGEIAVVDDDTALSTVNLYAKNVSTIIGSTIWTYIKSKMSGAISTVIGTNLDTRKAVVTDVNGKLSAGGATSTEVGYLSGVTHSLAISEATGSAAIGYNSTSSAGYTITGDYDANQPRRAWKMGGLAGITFHSKGTATAASANWTTLGTIPSAYRPKYVTPITAMIYDGNNGNQAAGGYIHTDGKVVLWTNAKSATNNYQVRVNATYLVRD